MRLRNTLETYGTASILFHWLTAAAFISAYVIVYYVIWFVDPQTSIKPALFGISPDAGRVVPLLNYHWILGITIGCVTLPRLVWRLSGQIPKHVGHSRVEGWAADMAHGALYLLLLVMPLTGYMTTYDPTDFGLFKIPACRDTLLSSGIRQLFGLTVEQLEEIMWAIHSFCGKWVASTLVVLHVVAALFHHFIRRDNVLRRMAPFGSPESEKTDTNIRNHRFGD